MRNNKKVPASPVPENKYKKFKLQLEEYSDIYSERNLMLFVLGIATGFRTQDLVDLTIADLKEAIEEEELIIQEKKQLNIYKRHIKENPGSRKKKPEARGVKIKSNLLKLLKQYCKHKKRSEYAFRSNKGGGREHITAKAYSNILSEVAKIEGLKNISGHSMRKTYARRLWESTQDLEFVRKNLGHKNIETTQRYLGLDREIMDDAAEIVDDRL